MNRLIPVIHYLNRYFLMTMVILMAVGLHILTTLEVNNTLVRVGITDLLLPVFITYIIINLLINKKTPELIVRNFWLWILAITAWMAVCLINGYYYAGSLVVWAFINKFIGWLILILYIFVGIYLGSQNNYLKIIFIKWMVMFAWFICMYEIILRFFNKFGYQPWFLPLHYRIQGFFENPNAFGICIATIIILQVIMQSRYKMFNKYVSLVGAVFCFMAVVYSYSRSAWLGLILGFITAMIINKKSIKLILGILSLSFLMIYVMFTLINKTNFEYIKTESAHVVNYDKNEKQINNLISSIAKIYISTSKVLNDISVINIKLTPDTKTEDKPKIINKTPEQNLAEVTNNHNNKKISIYDPDIMYRLKGDEGKSNTKRIDMIKRSYLYWLEKPVIGIGLGSYMWRSKKENVSEDVITIHNSALWLLVETGIVGLLIFSIFTYKTTSSLIKYGYIGENIRLDKAMVCIILVFLGASIGTEVLYQRYFWLLLGMSIVNIDKKTFIKP